MKNSLIYILLICMVTPVLSQPEPAYVSIYTTPSHTEIRVDSQIVGRSPILRLELSAGTHCIEAISPYPGLWNIQNKVLEITLTAGQDTTLTLRFERPVFINSVPYNARLYLNNHPIGETPLTLPFETFKGKEFSVQKLGYQTATFRLTSPKPILITLQPVPLTGAEGKNLPGSFTQSLFQSRLKTKFVLLTGTIVTHWLSFYFKNVADKNYDLYLHTADPTAMRNYWNATERYDRYSEISLGVSYALLSGLIYLLMTQ